MNGSDVRCGFEDVHSRREARPLYFRASAKGSQPYSANAFLIRPIASSTLARWLNAEMRT